MVEKIGLPKIKAKDIDKNKDNARDFIQLFIEKYYKMLGKLPARSKETWEKLDVSQYTLATFHELDDHVIWGGFIAVAQYGYVKFVFDNLFIETIRAWGAVKTANIVEKAKVIYEKYKEILEIKYDIDDRDDIYKVIPDFIPLNEEYYQIHNAETEIIKKYVENNLNDFGVIIE